MDLGTIFIITLIFIFIYVFFIRPFVLRLRKFKCLRCGQCCRLRVKLSKEDIKRLKKSGKKNFIEKGNWLRRINGYCMFLKIKNGKAKCLVYKNRPEICQGWPIRKFSCDDRCKSFSGKLI